MHCTYLLGIFVLLLLGIDEGSSNVKIPRENEALDIDAARDEKLFNITSDVALDSRQLVDIENTLNIVYKHFFGSPPTKLTLRRNVDAKTDLASTVSIIGDTICNQMRNVFKKFNVRPSSSNARSYDSKLRNFGSLKFSVYYQLMQMPLEIRPIFQEIQNFIKKYMEKNNYVRMGYARRKFSPETFGVNSTNQWEILAILNVAKTHSTKLYECLEKNDQRSSFDLKKFLGSLMNYSPRMVGHILSGRLERSLPNYPQIRTSEYDEIHAFVCHAATAGFYYYFRSCLVEIKRVDECVKAKIDNSLSESRPWSLDENELSTSFAQTIKSLDQSCVNITREARYSVDCEERKKMATNDEFLYIVDFLIGDMKKYPALGSMANEISLSVKTTNTGANTVRELANLIGIYQNAMEKKSKLEQTAGKDVARRHEEISENLSNYKQHLARMSLRAIKDVNEIVSNVEKIVVDSTSKVSRQDLSVNVRTLKCFSDLMDSIFGDWFHPQSRHPRHRNGTQSFTGHTRSSVSRDEITGPNEVGFVKNSHEEPLKKWIDSMKRLGHTSSPRRSTALSSLANTFLLATMFYECIALLAGAIYREDSGSVSPSFSAENDATDNWLTRDRRTSTLTDNLDHWVPAKEDEIIPVKSTITDVEKISTNKILPLFEKISQSYDNSSYSEFNAKHETSKRISEVIS